MNAPNLTIIESFIISPNELFISLRDNTTWDERMKARKTASFGVSYDYSGISYPQTDMPIELGAICDRIKDAVGFMPNNCLMNYYPDGLSTMGYHSDSLDELLEGTGVVIVSLGSARHISYRSKANKELKIKYLLNSGDMLYMDDKVQNNWMHAIPKEPEAGERISLTFRHIIKNV